MSRLFTTAAILAVSIASAPASADVLDLIGLDMNAGNGDFFVDDEADVFVFGGGSDVETIDINRDRAFRNIGTVGRGIGIIGWEVTRTAYSGGNAAFGWDGNFGFANPAGVGPGLSGQAFLNNGTTNLASTDYALGDNGFDTGTTIDLSYLLGGDQAATAQSTASLVFDRGLGTEFTHSFSLASRAGVDETTGQVMEQYVTTAPYTTLSVEFAMGTDGDNAGVDRALIDKVMLSADGTPLTGGDPADLDGDGDVDDADFGIAFAAFTGPNNGPSNNPAADLDGDGDVDDADFGIAFAAFTGPGAAAVPEPASLALLGLGGLLIARCRRA